MLTTRHSLKLATLATAALLALGSAGAARADWGGHWHGLHIPPDVPVAYDAFWKLKNPGGPVEINPQPLPPRIAKSFSNAPGSAASFNPQPHPPAVQ